MLKIKAQNYLLFYSTINTLSHYQGSYERLLREIDSLDECKRQDSIDSLPDFKDKVDVIYL